MLLSSLPTECFSLRCSLLAISVFHFNCSLLAISVKNSWQQSRCSLGNKVCQLIHTYICYSISGYDFKTLHAFCSHCHLMDFGWLPGQSLFKYWFLKAHNGQHPDQAVKIPMAEGVKLRVKNTWLIWPSSTITQCMNRPVLSGSRYSLQQDTVKM